MTSFHVHTLKAETAKFAEVAASTAWKQQVRPMPEAYSPGKYLPVSLHPLIGAVSIAYNRHYPLALSPDAIWTTIAQGLAKHIELNAEELRHHFVQHEGKKYLEIERNEFVKGNPTNDWPGAFAEFSEKIGAHIGKKKDLIVSSFTTTTPVARAASELVLMYTMKSYFRYGMRTMCGFPLITLEGTVEDWESVYTRAATLAEFELGWWTDHLLPVLDQFVKAAKRKPEADFWRRAYRETGGSGGPFIDGWVNAFFPYLGNRRNENVAWADAKGWGPTPDAYPSGLSGVPMLWYCFNETFNMQLIGGLVGVEQRDDGTVTPAFGWAVADDPDAKQDHKCESAHPLDYDYYCKHCGRTLKDNELHDQAQALIAKELAKMEKELGPPKNKKDAYNRKDTIVAALLKK
ncbi:conserved hypothetical protein [Virus Rctr197k]|nr:conserved hypothetical protein [Virus Rctr197k]